MDKSMNGNMSEYFEHLDSKIVEDYNETVKCFEEFEPAIAIVEVGKSSEGLFSIQKYSNQKSNFILNSSKLSLQVQFY